MLPQLQAERQLAAIEAASVPHMGRDGHREVIRKYTGLLSREVPVEKPTVEGLAAIGITVETVGADGMPVGDGTTRDDLKGRT